MADGEAPATRCPRCGTPVRTLRHPLWRAGDGLVCRSCYGRSIERELTRGAHRAQLRIVAIALLVVGLVVAVAVLGPAGRDPSTRTRSPAECITRAPETC